MGIGSLGKLLWMCLILCSSGLGDCDIFYICYLLVIEKERFVSSNTF
jgi:hypothetical protein